MSSSFRIRGGDRKEYGPASSEQVLEWIRTGRADRLTPTCTAESPVWRPLGSWPELAHALPPAPPHGRPTPAATLPESLPPAEELRNRPLAPHVLDAFAEGSKLVFRQPRAVIGSVVVTGGILLAAAAAGFVPYAILGVIPILGILAAQLWTGLSLLTLRAWRGHTAKVADVFAGFRSGFGRIVLAFISLFLLTGLCVLPAVALIVLGLDMGGRAQDLTPVAATSLVGGAFLFFILAVVPFAFWGFAPTLILERQLPTGEAFRLSRRITTRHPLRSLLFAAGCAILLLLGFLLGGIGLVVTAPWVLGARARMHDELFGTRHATAA